MSNALAIATVTETLVNVLHLALLNGNVSNVSVTKTRPDASDLPKVGVNVFLYQVSPNAAWRNADLPTRTPDGSLLRRPQAALDLFYLLTFYGDDTTLDQQRLLGTVVRQMHANPVLAPASVTTALSDAVANNFTGLVGSDLAGQIDPVRFTPVNFSLEELSKLWSVFLKTDYVLSVAYAASVVLIQTDDLPPAPALPVLKRHVAAVPFNLAVINSVQPQAVALSSPPATTQITLNGQGFDSVDGVNFQTPGTTNLIPGAIVTFNAAQNQLVVALPPGLRPGINSVSVARYATPASPPGATERLLAQSNTVAFMVLPTLLNVTLASPPGINVLISPPVGPDQKVSLLLNQMTASPPGNPLAFELPGVPDASQPGVFDFSTSHTPVGTTASVAVPSGSYLVRVRVDAAESRLETVPGGGFSGPIVNV